MNERNRLRRGGLWIALGLLVLVIALLGLNTTRAPMRLARTFVESVEAGTGWDVELRGAHFVGMTKLRLTDVAVRSEEEGLHGELPVVDLTVNPLRLLFGRDGAPAVGSVRLVRPRFTVGALESGEGGSPAVRPAPAEEGGMVPAREQRRVAFEVSVADGLLEEVTPQGETLRLWRLDGRMEVRGGSGASVLHQARLKQVGGGIEATIARERQGDDDVYRWQAKGPAEFFLGLLGAGPWEVTGALEADGTLVLGEGAPALDAVRPGRLSAVVTGGEIAWGDSDEERAAFDTLEVEVQGQDEAWHVEKLTLRKGEALVRATGEIRPPGTTWQEGAPADAAMEGAEVELAVSATGLVFPRDLPVLERYGLAGKSEFEGALTGRLSEGHLVDPELSGRLSIRDGAVWHRPVTRGEGYITLTSDRFRIDESVLERGFSTYSLSGDIEWASSPGSLRLVLDTKRGALDELLKAFAVAVDATGQIDGTISIQGRFGDVQVAGRAQVTEATVGDVRYFDHAQGRFSWNDGRLALEGVEAQSGEGVARLAGTLNREALALDVALTRWPLSAGHGVLATLEDGVQGWISYSGRLSGSADAPRLEGQLLGGELAVGRLFMSDPKGAVSVTPDALELADLSLVSAGQGTYRMSGAVRGWREAAPTVDLNVQVEGASLSGLLQEIGVAVPAWLFDGRVDGSVRLTGDARRPDAIFDVALADDLGISAPIRLQFGLQDGRLKLSRETVLGALRNASLR